MPQGLISWRRVFTRLLLGWAFAGRVSGGFHTVPAVSAAPEPSVPRRQTPATDAFQSAASCASLMASGQRLPRAPGMARFASWNLHWFPDGMPGESRRDGDVTWLACALAWLDADVVAVQEVKQSPRAEQALATLLGELNRWSGGHHVARLDDCGRRVSQHVGLIWNEARVKASDVTTIPALNPHGAPCENQLRPGLAARLRFRGGLDLSAVSAHFKSRADRHGFELRATSFAAVPGVLRSLTEAARDADFLLLGDLNTMGCDECTNVVSAREEVVTVARRLSAAGLRFVPADAAGSELYRGRLTLLDHALAATAMRELAANTYSHVAGMCAAGAPISSARAAKHVRRTLSDHCPLVLDLIDRDLD